MEALGTLFAQALENVVRDEAVVFDYGDCATFLRLWKTGDDGNPAVFPEINGKSAIIIVWDGRDLEGSDPKTKQLELHLTPMDWALALSIKVLANKSVAENADWRIHIVDLTGRNHDDAWSIHMRHQMRVDMPWVTLHAPLLPKRHVEIVVHRRGYQPILPLVDEDPCSALLEQNDDGSWTIRSRKSTLALGLRRGHENALRQLARQWSASLVQSNDHHDLNNILGPMVLLEGFQQTSATSEPRLAALLQRIRWLGSAPDHPMRIAMRGDDCWYDARGLATRLGRAIRFVLVDDQVNDGWGKIVARAMGLSYDPMSLPVADSDNFKLLATENNVELWATTGPRPVIKRLTEFLAPLEGKQHPRDAHFELLFTPHDVRPGAEKSPFEILLFDLRLESVNTAAAETFDMILRLVEPLNERFSEGRWPWQALTPHPQGDATGLRDLRDWLANYKAGETTTRDETYLTFLTLLPRIIATQDMSHPIIVFSSTGQRHVSERFKGYGNIITAFDKPRFASYQAEDIYSDTKNKWQSAVQQAANILHARLAIQFMQSQGFSPPDRLETDTNRKYIAELYLDETGNEFGKGEVAVGGLLIVGQENKVKELHALKHEWNDKKSRYDKKALRESIKRFITEVHDFSINNNVHCSLVCLRGRRDPHHPMGAAAGSVESILRADNLYRELVSTLTEICVYHVSADVCGEQTNAEYGIYIGTRVKPSEDQTSEEELWQRWGIPTVNVGQSAPIWDSIESLDRVRDADPELQEIRLMLNKYVHQKAEENSEFQKNRCVRYVDFATARPIVQGVSKQYRTAMFQPRPEHARAYLLNQPDRLRCDLHLIADYAISQTSPGSVEAELRRRGFSGDYDECLTGLLFAAREAVTDSVGEGLGRAARCIETMGCTDNYWDDDRDVHRLILGRLARIAMQMSGPEFMQMVRGAIAIVVEDENRQSGVVKKWFGDRGFGFIIPDKGGKDVFMHISNVQPPVPDVVTEGQKVSFELGYTHKGVEAVNVAVVI